jgi:hypothetical protein
VGGGSTAAEGRPEGGEGGGDAEEGSGEGGEGGGERLCWILMELERISTPVLARISTESALIKFVLCGVVSQHTAYTIPKITHSMMMKAMPKRMPAVSRPTSATSKSSFHLWKKEQKEASRYQQNVEAWSGARIVIFACDTPIPPGVAAALDGLNGISKPEVVVGERVIDVSDRLCVTHAARSLVVDVPSKCSGTMKISA